MSNIVKGFFNVKERCFYKFISVEAFHNSLGQANKMVICWFGLPKARLTITLTCEKHIYKILFVVLATDQKKGSITRN